MHNCECSGVKVDARFLLATSARLSYIGSDTDSLWQSAAVMVRDVRDGFCACCARSARKLVLPMIVSYGYTSFFFLSLP